MAESNSKKPNKPRAQSDAADLNGSARDSVDVIATISHEIRTPLHAVMGLCELLRDEVSSDAGHRHLDKILGASSALLQTLNTTIDAARAQQGDLSVNLVPVNLQFLLESVTKMFALNAEHKQVQLTLRMDPKLLGLTVVSDPGRLLQILSNLLNNSVKFTDEGSIALWAVVHRSEEERVSVRFIVEDTGIGIPPDKQEAVLEPFQQISSSQSGRPSGSGLGLSICNQLVALMGGKLKLRSTLGSGSRFEFELDFQKESSACTPAPEVNPTESVAVVDYPGVNAEMLLGFAESLGARVDYFQQISLDVLNRPYALTIVGCEVAAANPVAWNRLNQWRGTGQVVMQCNELDPPPIFLESQCIKWYAPYLPSQFIDYARNAGLLVGDTSKSAQFTAKSDASPDTGIKLLCVDDSPTNLIVLRGALGKLGYTHIEQARDGEHAVEQWRMHPDVDCVIIDFNMPKMNGMEAARVMRAEGAECCIICLTALSGDELEQAMAAQVFDEIITKPAGSETLRDSLTKWFPANKDDNNVE